MLGRERNSVVVCRRPVWLCSWGRLSLSLLSVVYRVADVATDDDGICGNEVSPEDSLASDDDETRNPAWIKAMYSLGEKTPGETIDEPPIWLKTCRNLSDN